MKRLPVPKLRNYNNRLYILQLLSLAAMKNYNDMLYAFKLINGLSSFQPSVFGFTLSTRSIALAYLSLTNYCIILAYE